MTDKHQSHVPWKPHIENYIERRNPKGKRKEKAPEGPSKTSEGLCGNTWPKKETTKQHPLELWENRTNQKEAGVTLYISNWLSKKEHRVDALALRADERRDKLRKASGRSKYPLIRRYLNGETWLSKPQPSWREFIASCREPPELKHLSRARKRKKHRFPK